MTTDYLLEPFGRTLDSDFLVTSTVTFNNSNGLVDAVCTGSVNTKTLNYTNLAGSLANNQRILIVQMQGTGAGVYKEENEIESFTGSVITTKNPLRFTYGTGAQFIVLKEYRYSKINASFNLNLKAWDRSTGKGGLAGWLCSGDTIISGTLNGGGAGFAGGPRPTVNGSTTAASGSQGEGHPGLGTQEVATPNGNGGGGTAPGTHAGGSGGGGGGGAVAGDPGIRFPASPVLPGEGGAAFSSLASSIFAMGGGGGSGANDGSNIGSGAGGNGGALIFISSRRILVESGGSISVVGQVGGTATLFSGAGGGGGGGTIYLRSEKIDAGANRILATGGAKGIYVDNPGTSDGGKGGDGLIVLAHCRNVSTTTNPTFVTAGYQKFCGRVGTL